MVTVDELVPMGFRMPALQIMEGFHCQVLFLIRGEIKALRRTTWAYRLLNLSSPHPAPLEDRNGIDSHFNSYTSVKH